MYFHFKSKIWKKSIAEICRVSCLFLYPTNRGLCSAAKITTLVKIAHSANSHSAVKLYSRNAEKSGSRRGISICDSFCERNFAHYSIYAITHSRKFIDRKWNDAKVNSEVIMLKTLIFIPVRGKVSSKKMQKPLAAFRVICQAIKLSQPLFIFTQRTYKIIHVYKYMHELNSDYGYDLLCTTYGENWRIVDYRDSGHATRTTFFVCNKIYMNGQTMFLHARYFVTQFDKVLRRWSIQQYGS